MTDEQDITKRLRGQGCPQREEAANKIERLEGENERMQIALDVALGKLPLEDREDVVAYLQSDREWPDNDHSCCQRTRADEREACARLCEGEAYGMAYRHWPDLPSFGDRSVGHETVRFADMVSAVIRARGTLPGSGGTGDSVVLQRSVSGYLWCVKYDGCVVVQNIPSMEQAQEIAHRVARKYPGTLVGWGEKDG
mgnify:CR=1 FL=1